MPVGFVELRRAEDCKPSALVSERVLRIGYNRPLMSLKGQSLHLPIFVMSASTPLATVERAIQNRRFVPKATSLGNRHATNELSQQKLHGGELDVLKSSFCAGTNLLLQE